MGVELLAALAEEGTDGVAWASVEGLEDGVGVGVTLGVSEADPQLKPMEWMETEQDGEGAWLGMTMDIDWAPPHWLFWIVEPPAEQS